jgi:hypothetical protein
MQQNETNDANEYRLAQARRLMACYLDANGEPAPSTEVLLEWVAANPDRIPRDASGTAVPLYEEPSERFKLLWRKEEA